MGNRRFNNRQELYDFVDQMYFDLQDQLYFPNGENWWPLLRIQLVYRLVMVDEVNYTQFKQKYSFSASQKPLNIFQRLKLQRERNAIQRTANEIGQIQPYTWCVVSFLEHYYTINGEQRNLYVSPFKNKLIAEGVPFAELLLGNVSREQDVHGIRQVYNLWFNYFKKDFSDQLSKKKWAELFNNNTQLIGSYLERNGVNEELFDTSVLTYVQREHYPIYWAMRETLKAFRVSKIWLYCYYDLTMMSLCRAAHDLNIKVYEYQHSAQGSNHFAYSKLIGIKNALYFFPDVFVVWDEHDAKRIKEVVSTDDYHPEVFISGNLSVAEDFATYNYKTVDAKNAVLITLQGYWLPDFVVRTIEENVDVKWYIRFHPRYPFDREKGEELFKRFPERVEIEQANSCSIPELLTKCVLHVTDSSGAALEALNYSVPSIIIGENGLITYRDYIGAGNMFSALTIEEFSKLIENRSYLAMNLDNGVKIDDDFNLNRF